MTYGLKELPEPEPMERHQGEVRLGPQKINLRTWEPDYEELFSMLGDIAPQPKVVNTSTRET
jgi:hypothetical protein